MFNRKIKLQTRVVRSAAVMFALAAALTVTTAGSASAAETPIQQYASGTVGYVDYPGITVSCMPDRTIRAIAPRVYSTDRTTNQVIYWQPVLFKWDGVSKWIQQTNQPVAWISDTAQADLSGLGYSYAPFILNTYLTFTAGPGYYQVRHYFYWTATARVAAGMLGQLVSHGTYTTVTAGTESLTALTSTGQYCTYK